MRGLDFLENTSTAIIMDNFSADFLAFFRF